MWDHCCNQLASELPQQHFDAWIRPLQVVEDSRSLRLLAPNHFVREKVEASFMPRIRELILLKDAGLAVSLGVGSTQTARQPHSNANNKPPRALFKGANNNKLNAKFTFGNFVEGKSNEIAMAMSLKTAKTPGDPDNNPLLIYGGTGLGKTHLMHAAGNAILKNNGAARVAYLHSETFVSNMVKALRGNAIDEFKDFYRNVDALLIDDIQFFVGKERSQEEFFHTFNRLLESDKQVILTCDRYHKEVDGIEDRLKSRCGGGLTAAVYPPDTETRQAILKSKAEQARFEMPDNVAFFVARRIQSNVRELEGALRKIIAHARFTNQSIDMDLTREALRDLLAVHQHLVSVENIQKAVAGYYKIRVADLISKRKTQSVVRPRHLAMALTKALTNHSLPEIGDAFGGRDHTTVLHACRKIEDLLKSDSQTKEDYENLLRSFTA